MRDGVRKSDPIVLIDIAAMIRLAHSSHMCYT